MSDELTQFLWCHYINHVTSSPHFPWYNGFIECHVRSIKTALSTTQDTSNSIEELLLYLQSTPSGPTCLCPERSCITGPFSALASLQHPLTWSESETSCWQRSRVRSITLTMPTMSKSNNNSTHAKRSYSSPEQRTGISLEP